MNKTITLIITLFILLVNCLITNAQLIAGGDNQSLFRCSNGTVWSCGNNVFGQLGDGSTNSATTPIQVRATISPVTFFTGVIAVAAGGVNGGESFSLFLKNDGTAWACGLNSSNQLGAGSGVNQSLPVQVSNVTGITAIEAGGRHSLFLKNDGTVWACGSNSFGQLGDGTTTLQPLPVQVSSLSGIIAIAAGVNHSLFLKDDSTVWACGLNASGQLGDGTTIDRLTPVQIGGLSGIVAIAAGGAHSLFLKNDGTVWVCGENAFGQLGDGTTIKRYSPVQATALNGIIAIAAGGIGLYGEGHSLFLKDDSTVWACGYNYYGQLGDSTNISKNTPVRLNALGGITAIATGNSHSLFQKSDGTFWACGRNYNGQLGNGNYTDKSTPVNVTLSCGTGTGLQELGNNVNVAIYPNPFSSSATIIIDKKGNYDLQFTMHDLLGKEVLHSIINTQLSIINRNNLPSGIYFYKIQNENKTIAIGKIVVSE